MSIGGIIGDAINAGLGNNSYSTNLQDFLSKFSNSSGKHVTQLNPLNTFEVNFKFFPNKLGSNSDSKWYEKIGSSANQAAKNLVNNATGGLLASLRSESVIDMHNKFDGIGQRTFLEYLAQANLIVDEGWLGKPGDIVHPFELQLGYFVQDITIPQLKIIDGEQIQTMVGNIQTHGIAVVPDNNNLQMTILNTKLPLIERIFYPWMREVTLPYWSYHTQPYTTATIVVDFSKHTDMQYVFTGCRPTQLQTMTASQENDQSFRRQVTFTFDFMFINSKLTTIDDIKTKALGALGTLTNSVAGMINL